MNPRDLKKRLPYQFDGEHLEFGFARGWFPLFAALCEDIDTLLGDDKHGFRWVQLKEKFGTATWYWSLADEASELHVDTVGETEVTTMVTRVGGAESAGQPSHAISSLFRRISDMVDEATNKTRQVCIVCGEPGSVSRTERWLLVLCELHAEQRRHGPLASIWFSEEEK